MLRKDFIMVQIEELGKIIAQLILNRNSNDGAKENPELIRSIYSSLKISEDYLLSNNPEDIRHYLDHDDACGLQRMELAAKTLLEDSYITSTSAAKKLRQKSKELLEYIQRNDTTFSLERLALIEEIETKN